MTNRLTPSPIALLALLAPLALAVPAGAQDGSFTHPAYSEPGSNDELADRSDLGNVAQRARLLYSEGNRSLARAVKLEKKLDELAGDKRAAQEAKIVASREQAVAKFTEAVGLVPTMLEAYTGLGEAYASLGQHRERLQVHSAALKVAPGDEANFRGWAASLLALDLLGDATRAWDHFHAADPPKADILRAEMEAWLERRRAEPGDLTPEAIEKMAGWLAEHG